ncbi:MAG: TusE/DsrC/DsvC family sulfur relay protein [bacterium]|nr:TusE/DsrC/DsvC family sulfur relay protein [bacterium]
MNPRIEPDSMLKELKENRLVVGGQEIPLDDGFLPQPEDWNDQIALAFADDDGLELTEASWEVIHLMREMFFAQGEAPHNKVLMNRYAELKGLERTEAIKTFYRLFPLGPIAQAARIAGLPKPRRCCT